MKIISLSTTRAHEVITIAQNHLKKGGLVIFPSDTVYGALVDATDEKAVQKLIAFKNRPLGKPISVFVANMTELASQVFVKHKQKKLLKELLPGPFTLVLPSRHRVSPSLESERGSLGVRIPDFDLLQKLMQTYKKPITATSANLSGRSPHYSVQALLQELPQTKKSLIDLVVDVGNLPRNKPSTIVDLTSEKLKILRKGDIIMSGISSTFLSHSPSQTKAVARYFLKKHTNTIQSKPLVCIIKGELGVGKTVFIKGIGEKLGIDNIISPTYVIYYEYDIFFSTVKKLYHFDLYQISEKEEFEHLAIRKILKPGNLLCFEWGEKAGDILPVLKKNAKVVFIEMKYVNEKEREIIINN